MRTYRARRGPLAEALFFKRGEIDQICTDELSNSNLLPKRPEPIRIERFVEKRFGVTPQYEDLPDGILGYTSFGSHGVQGVFVSRTLVEDGSVASERLANSTLAHEAGHGLLHAHLFALEQSALTSIFGRDLDPQAPKILCRDPKPQSSGSAYDGRWWEFQANQAIGALLLPRILVIEAVKELLSPPSAFGRRDLGEAERAKAVLQLSQLFAVNPIVARIRLGELFPPAEGQLTL